MSNLSIQNPDSIEKPVRHGEEECEGGEEGTVHAHPGQAGPARPQKQGPNSNHEDEELKGDGEEEPLAGGSTGLQSVGPHHSWKKQKDQRRGQHQQAHT